MFPLTPALSLKGEGSSVLAIFSEEPWQCTYGYTPIPITHGNLEFTGI
jgi:hypothetical protein